METELVLAAVGKGVAVASKVIGALRAINTSPLDEQIRSAGKHEFDRMIVVAYATARALIARELGREPTDQEVDSFLDAAGQGPSFAPRVYRLFSEGMRSSSQRRRRFLCSVLFGLQFTKIPEDELDRVDLAVERMLPGDAIFLMRIADIHQTPANPDASFLGGVPYGEARPTKCEAIAIQSPTDLRIVTSNEYSPQMNLERTTTDARFAFSATELSSLESLGCVHRSESEASNGTYAFHILDVTPLGELVLRALKEVRAGCE